MQNADLGGATQGLVNDAIAFGQTEQGRDLLFACVSVQIEVQPNLLEPNGHIFGNAERSTKIEIAFGTNRGLTERNAESSGNRAQCHTCASNQRFEQHVGRTRALSITSGRRMQPGFDARFSGLDFARDIFADLSLGVKGDRRCFRTLAILRFERRLQ